MLNLASLKTPGVYIDEVALFPPSVAQVATAIPAFIGYTKKALKDGNELKEMPTRISSMPEYELYFGGAPNASIEVTLDNSDRVYKVSPTPKWYLYNSLRMFYANGGGACYIISLGDYSKSIDQDEFINALESLKKWDEPTLIVMPDLVAATTEDVFNAVSQAAISLCAEMQDRFAILDVYKGNEPRTFDDNDVITKFRDGIGINELKYAAAYYPSLRTSLPFKFNFSNLVIKREGNINEIFLSSLTSDSDILNKIKQAEALKDDLKLDALNNLLGDSTYKTLKNPDGANDDEKKANAKQAVIDFSAAFKALAGWKYIEDLLTPTEKNSKKVLTTDKFFELYTAVGKSEGAKLERLESAVVALDLTTLTIHHLQEALIPLLTDIQAHIGRFVNELQNRADALDLQLATIFPVYGNIVNAIRKEGVVVPPSGAIAGIYAKTDETRGVWKAPANVSLSNVIEPVVKITDKEQEDLNVDVNSGKSINAIRHFTGKGTLVWGARTLAGNDNEWRYVPVRRFFIMVEESVKKATDRFVFEPNDANTWVKVRAMIENFLTLQWRAGALAGAKPEHAFYVQVGLNQTMTQLDILEGRMIVEIGMAVVRPAEFIVLRFMHKMQES